MIRLILLGKIMIKKIIKINLKMMLIILINLLWINFGLNKIIPNNKI